MNGKLTAKLAIGPMSVEIVEAIYDLSEKLSMQFMLIASKNQIDHSSGYVNNWTTATFSDHLSDLKRRYPEADVIICRDHCGPGFNGIDDMQDTYQTIDADLKAGFDLIHIDLCHMIGDHSQKLLESQRLIDYIKCARPETLIEIGTDEIGSVDDDIDRVRDDVDFFCSFCDPEFYVVRTGSLVKETQQVGSFERAHVERLQVLLSERGTKLKEHNADYLSPPDINLRRGAVDAINIAPEIGVVQTRYVLNQSKLHGISVDEFIDVSYASMKWVKWIIDSNCLPSREQCAIIAGHYNFTSSAYKRLCDSLRIFQPSLERDIMDEIQKVLTVYIDNL